MQGFDYESGTRLVFGAGALTRLGGLAAELGAGRVLVVTDQGIAAAGILASAVESLAAAGLEHAVFDGVEKNPGSRHVESGRRFAGELPLPADFVVALGGGSAMDCAKGINFLLTNGGRIEDYHGDGKAKKPLLPAIGVPTTAGTGSEAQRFALIGAGESGMKMACGDRSARFRAALLDPELTATAPREVAAAAAADAVSHAVESFVSANGNEVSRMFAARALHLLAASLRESLRGGSVEARAGMLLGAHWAGAAIENSMLGAAHACANPLTARYGITHGVAVGVMLPHVIRFNGPAVDGHYTELARAAGLEKAGADALAECVRGWNAAADLPERLRDLDVEAAALPELARQAASQRTAGFNPRPAGERELAGLYAAAF